MLSEAFWSVLSKIGPRRSSWDRVYRPVSSLGRRDHTRWYRQRQVILAQAVRARDPIVSIRTELTWKNGYLGLTYRPE